MKRKLNIKNCFIALVSATILAVGIWVIASVIDTNLNNMSSQEFAKWNIFIIMN